MFGKAYQVMMLARLPHKLAYKDSYIILLGDEAIYMTHNKIRDS
jgi:hypothetical protein